MKTLPFYLLLILTLGLAGIEKLVGMQVPAWFVTQFQNSLLNPFPGSLTLSFIFITALEVASFVMLSIGVIKKEFSCRHKPYLTYGVILSQITFIALGFGQRLTHQYEAAGSLFFYAALTFIGGHIALNESSK